MLVGGVWVVVVAVAMVVVVVGVLMVVVASGVCVCSFCCCFSGDEVGHVHPFTCL